MRKKRIEGEELLNLLKKLPSCLVLNCPNVNSIRTIIKQISNAEEVAEEKESILMIGDYCPVNYTDNKEFMVPLNDENIDFTGGTISKYSMVRIGRTANTPYYRIHSLPQKKKLLYKMTLSEMIKKKHSRIMIVQEMFMVGNPAFDKELWAALNNPPRKGFTFIGFSTMDTMTELSIKNSAKNLVVFNYEEFKKILSGESGTERENESIQSHSTKNYDDMMDGHSFELFCAELLRENGFENVVVTPGSGDQGIDIICRKDDVKYGIQCKCYSKDIGNKAVQEAYSGAQFYKCHVPVVLTNRDFTPSARTAAEKTNVVLWNRQKLEALIKSASNE